MTGTLSSNVTSATYCTSTDNICEPTTSASISGGQYTVELSNATAKRKEVASPIGTLYVATASNQIVCTQLNGTSKVICSNPEKVGYDELVADNTADNNLRYIGTDPNNYVLFNDELWRIIGVFSEDSHGVSGQKLIKIIRNDSIGNIAWDSANTNDWSTVSLQTTLNGDYLNGSGSYASTGIKSDTARNMIETITWKLGGSSTYNDVTASMFYERERGTTVYSGHATEWVGEVGLMYPSDYGYATSGGSATDREACLAKEVWNWDSSSFSDCRNNDWLLDSSYNQWTLTPSSSNSNSVFFVNSCGYLSISSATNGNGARPSIYLKSNISISGGDGSENNPYLLKQ